MAPTRCAARAQTLCQEALKRASARSVPSSAHGQPRAESAPTVLALLTQLLCGANRVVEQRNGFNGSREAANAGVSSTRCAAASRLPGHQPDMHGGAAVPDLRTAMRVQRIPRTQVLSLSSRFVFSCLAWLEGTWSSLGLIGVVCAEFAPAFRAMDTTQAKIAWRLVQSSIHQSSRGFPTCTHRQHTPILAAEGRRPGSVRHRTRLWVRRVGMCDKWRYFGPDALARRARRPAIIRSANATMPLACVGVQRAYWEQIVLDDVKYVFPPSNVPHVKASHSFARLICVCDLVRTVAPGMALACWIQSTWGRASAFVTPDTVLVQLPCPNFLPCPLSRRLKFYGAEHDIRAR